jgi:hypothetical protein
MSRGKNSPPPEGWRKFKEFLTGWSTLRLFYPKVIQQSVCHSVGISTSYFSLHHLDSCGMTKIRL